VLYPGLTNYFNSYVYPHPDSMATEVDKVINRFNTGKLMYETVLKSLMRFFANSQMMIHEPVYVYIAREYFLKGKAPWADADGLGKLEKRVNEILPSMLYTKAPDFIITDTVGNKFSFYQVYNEVKPDYTILAFWNSDCSHCKTEMPQFSNIYDEKISKLPFKVNVVSVGTDKELDRIKKFLVESKENQFISGYDPSSWFSVLYDVKSTPMIFIMDKNMKIIAKKISVESLHDFLKNYHEDQKKTVSGQ
jgi:thiol-disulfide isomerase/thioredoxin